MARAVLALFLVFACFSAGGTDFVNPRFSTRVLRNIPYGTAKQLTLDLYEPAGKHAPPLRPALVAIHGGGWTHGSSRNENIVDLCERLAERGFVCVSINYRLAGLNAAIVDAELAVNWLAHNAKRYRVDPSRIAIGGSSAGAITALHVAYGRRNARIRAVLSWAGGLEGNEDIVKAGGPPLLIIHGDADRSIPVAEARALAARSRAVGLRSIAYICADIGHNAPLDRRPFGVSLHDRIARFLFDSMNLTRLATVQPQPPPAGSRGAETIQCPH